MQRLLLGSTLALLASCSGTPAAKQEVHPDALPAQLVAVTGERIDLATSLASEKEVVLVFWQTWCKSCKAEAPELVEAYERHGDRATFIGVVPGGAERVDPAEIRTTASSWGLPYPQVQDRDLALTRAFGITGTPTVLVLGAGGGLLYRGHALPDDLGALLE